MDQTTWYHRVDHFFPALHCLESFYLPIGIPSTARWVFYSPCRPGFAIFIGWLPAKPGIRTTHRTSPTPGG